MTLPSQPPIAQDAHDNPVAGAFDSVGPDPGIASAPSIGYFTYTTADGQVIGLAYPQQTGPTVKIVNMPGTSITANTQHLDVFTPSAGKRFRVISYHLSSAGANASIIMEDGSGNEFLRTPNLAANTGQPSPSMGAGYASTNVGNHLFLSVTVTGAVSGWIAVSEEL